MIRTASYTDTGGRPYNEDCLAFIDRGGALCAVAAGGLPCMRKSRAATRTAAASERGMARTPGSRRFRCRPQAHWP